MTMATASAAKTPPVPRPRRRLATCSRGASLVSGGRQSATGARSASPAQRLADRVRLGVALRVPCCLKRLARAYGLVLRVGRAVALELHATGTRDLGLLHGLDRGVGGLGVDRAADP